MKSLTLASSTIKDLKVGDLLKNDDREGRIFGRITRIVPLPGNWSRVTINPEDKQL